VVLACTLAVAAGGSTSAAPVPAVVVERGGDLYAVAVDRVAPRSPDKDAW